MRKTPEMIFELFVNLFAEDPSGNNEILGACLDHLTELLGRFWLTVIIAETEPENPSSPYIPCLVPLNEIINRHGTPWVMSERTVTPKTPDLSTEALSLF